MLTYVRTLRTTLLLRSQKSSRLISACGKKEPRYACGVRGEYKLFRGTKSYLLAEMRRQASGQLCLVVAAGHIDLLLGQALCLAQVGAQE